MDTSISEQQTLQDNFMLHESEFAKTTYSIGIHNHNNSNCRRIKCNLCDEDMFPRSYITDRDYKIIERAIGGLIKAKNLDSIKFKKYNTDSATIIEIINPAFRQTNMSYNINTKNIHEMNPNITNLENGMYSRGPLSLKIISSQNCSTLNFVKIEVDNDFILEIYEDHCVMNEYYDIKLCNYKIFDNIVEFAKRFMLHIQ